MLIIAERIGKGIRNPPRDAMLSHAARNIGYGRAFGLHEALDQFGALFGPLLVALVLAVDQHDYEAAFAVLAVPAVIMLSLLAVARMLYPRPQDLAAGNAPSAPDGLPRVFWTYLAGAALWGLGMSVQESLIPAAVAPMVSPARRAHAYGLFTAVYGTAWVAGSIVIGVLVNVSAGGLVAFCMAAGLAAIPLILTVRRRTGQARQRKD